MKTQRNLSSWTIYCLGKLYQFFSEGSAFPPDFQSKFMAGVRASQKPAVEKQIFPSLVRQCAPHPHTYPMGEMQRDRRRKKERHRSHENKQNTSPLWFRYYVIKRFGKKLVVVNYHYMDKSLVALNILGNFLWGFLTLKKFTSIMKNIIEHFPNTVINMSHITMHIHFF